MKKLVLTSMIVMMVAGTSWALTSMDGTKLNGPHETLNIIGVQNPKKMTSQDLDEVENVHGVGSTIFVNLDGTSKINLIDSATVEGLDKDFAVLDKNGTDNDGALFALPKPGYDPYEIGTEEEVKSDYTIYVQPLGKPGGYAIITTCADVITSALGDYFGGSDARILKDAEDDGSYCSLEQVGEDITMRIKGKTPITNVTAELTSIVLEVEILDEDGVVIDTIFVRIPIFDDMLENEYWQYENHGLKLLKVRIYPWSTNVAEGEVVQ